MELIHRDGSLQLKIGKGVDFEPLVECSEETAEHIIGEIQQIGYEVTLQDLIESILDHHGEL